MCFKNFKKPKLQQEKMYSEVHKQYRGKCKEIKMYIQ